MLNVHRTLLRRLVFSWFLVSVAIGGGFYYYGLEKIDDQLVDLAVDEAGKVSGRHLSLLNNPQPDKDRLEQLAEDFLQEHFVIVELYDRQHAKLVERVKPQYQSLEHRLKRKEHSFPQDAEPHYERLTLGKDTVLQVVVPLYDAPNDIGGYFEGVFLIDRETLQHLHDDLIVSLLTTLATVLLTTLVIYPVVLSLHRDVIRFSRDLLKGNIELMEVLGSAIAQRDSDTSIHNYRVSAYAVKLAEAAGLDREAIRNLIAGAFLHDVGKIGISDNILLKPAKLTEGEFKVMKTHVALGMDILRKSNWLQNARDVVEFHHEKYDGKGYLAGLKGEEIPVNARIFAIVDVFDALTSRRPYKEPMAFADAMAILRQDAGSHFDPRLVSIFDGIAEPLFREVSGISDEAVEALLQSQIDRYYFPGKA